MHIIAYLYRVPSQNSDRFLDIQREVASIYESHGSLGDETFVPFDLSTRHGCSAFPDVVDLVEDEVLFFGVTKFRDHEHSREVMAGVDADPRIDALFNEIKGVLRIERIVRGEFQRAR